VGLSPLKRPGVPGGRGRFQACSGPGQGGHLKPEHKAAIPDHWAPVKKMQGENLGPQRCQVEASKGLDKTGNDNHKGRNRHIRLYQNAKLLLIKKCS